MFVGNVGFELLIWGFEKHLKSLDVMEWKWEEGSFYDDFSAQREEYQGPTFMTDFGCVYTLNIEGIKQHIISASVWSTNIGITIFNIYEVQN